MARPAYRTSPTDTDRMPSGIPHIIGNEAAERFSFYGMKAILAVFLADYLHLMGSVPGRAMAEAAANERVHDFNTAVYLTPFLGAVLADALLGKYRVIIVLSLVYCLGHFTLALMGIVGPAPVWLFAGLAFIAIGSGGIKPCVSAHVGDQFGARNRHLLPKVFGWFYFSINLGAFISMLLTPFLLEWHGPHLAFGVPGILMALATLVFWMGRDRFVHVPAGGTHFVREVFSRDGLGALGQLTVFYLFIAMFWALFDQTGSSWIFQARDMDRRLLGVEWLPSQIQSVNSLFILAFIPLFAYGLYPAVDRVWKLTPLRKVGTGLALMITAFALAALIQTWIEAGHRPSIAWQVLAYALLTASEVMVSITALEFAYTQAPRRMKSVVMSLYLFSVAFGNFFTARVNQFIQIPEIAVTAGEVHPGFDGTPGTDDDLSRNEHGWIVSPVTALLADAGAALGLDQGDPPEPFPSTEAGNLLLRKELDPWGNPLRYALINSATARVSSAGPDGRHGTRWDLGVIVTRLPDSGSGVERAPTWLERRRRELGLGSAAGVDDGTSSLQVTWYAGGQTRLEGSAYFWFFTWLMAGTTALYVLASRFYRGKDHLPGTGGD